MTTDTQYQFRDSPRNHQKDQESKAQLVLDAIRNHGHATSPHADLRAIATALEQDHDELVATILTGGMTNYSYCVSLRKSPHVKVFAKIYFSYAMWNAKRDFYYDTQRAVNEFATMERFHGLFASNAPVATPYLCVDVPSDDSKVFVAQWAPADEQWGNQFMDGSVDTRVCQNVAQALARLNAMDFDDVDFNTGMSTVFDRLFAEFKAFGAQYSSDPERNDKAVELLREMGIDSYNSLIELIKNDYRSRDVLVHNDAHAFNTLVEAKPDVAELEQFGPNGLVYLCDWEMAYVGGSGRDVGLAQCYPISAALAHVAQGRMESAEHILDAVNVFYDEYVHEITALGKDDVFLKDQLAKSLTCISHFMLVQYFLGFLKETMPLDGLSGRERTQLRGTIGYIALKLLQLSQSMRGSSNTLKELRVDFVNLLKCEILELAAAMSSAANGGQRRNALRSSMLRASGRRVSDAAVCDEALRQFRASAVATLRSSDVARSTATE